MSYFSPLKAGKIMVQRFADRFEKQLRVLWRGNMHFVPGFMLPCLRLPSSGQGGVRGTLSVPGWR